MRRNATLKGRCVEKKMATEKEKKKIKKKMKRETKKRKYIKIKAKNFRMYNTNVLDRRQKKRT